MAMLQRHYCIFRTSSISTHILGRRKYGTLPFRPAINSHVRPIRACPLTGPTVSVAAKYGRTQQRLPAFHLAGTGCRDVSVWARRKASEAASAETPQSQDAATEQADEIPQPVKKRGRKKKAVPDTEPHVDVTAPSQQSVQPQINLHANIPQGAQWQRVDSWVVFSDLHVSLKTADVACQVLRRVREEAQARKAGILFLGETQSDTC